MIRMRSLIGVLLLTLWLGSGVAATDNGFTSEERDWIADNQNRTLHIGLAPYEGIDLFMVDGKSTGYIFDLAALLEQETGLTFVVDTDKPWGEAYQGLQDGRVDVLFGANPTPERLKFMAFTEALKAYPYVVIGRKNDSVLTIGDLDERTVGFIDGDQIIPVFPMIYKNIAYTVKTFDSPRTAIEALEVGYIDGVVTAGTEIVDEILLDRPSVGKVATVRNQTSDMTLSTRLEDQLLAGILNKVINQHRPEINLFIEHASTHYFRQMLIRTGAERQWLEENPVITVGVASDYLPIDYVTGNGDYAGVSGAYFNQFASMIGLEVETVFLPFDELYERILAGEIDMLNMARTEDRLAHFIFTDAFSDDRDVIYGHKDSDHVFDIYNLEGKTVAVIEGFWHEEYLLKNLETVDIRLTKSIESSLAMVAKGTADYLIENPVVGDYYIEGLGYQNITLKGETSSDSLLYYGLLKVHQPLVNMLNRSMVLLDYDKAVYDGIKDVPSLTNLNTRRVIYMLMISVFILAILSLVLVQVLKVLVRQRTETSLLQERQAMMYQDALTGMHNRLFFNSLKTVMDEKAYPQCFIIMDLNDLKGTNDRWGHAAGDRLIQAFSEALVEVLPENSVMRMGGDEFFAFIEDCGSARAGSLVDDLKSACASKVADLRDICDRGPLAAYGFYTYVNRMGPPLKSRYTEPTWPCISTKRR